MYVSSVCLADFLGYIVYDYGNRDKLSQEDRTIIAGYCFPKTDGIILVRHKDKEPAHK